MEKRRYIPGNCQLHKARKETFPGQPVETQELSDKELSQIIGTGAYPRGDGYYRHHNVQRSCDTCNMAFAHP